MNTGHKNDIGLGKDQWITWVDVDTSIAQPFNIDPLLESTKPFWQAIETECVSACCGIQAFAFWPEDIKKASAQFDQQTLCRDFDMLMQQISQRPETELSSLFLNNLFTKTVFLELIRHIRKEL